MSPDQILVTAGTSPAMLLLFSALLDPGDEVMLSDPHYACYPNFVQFADGVPVYVPAEASDGLPVPTGCGDARSPPDQGLLVNSPANPTGAVLSR